VVNATAGARLRGELPWPMVAAGVLERSLAELPSRDLPADQRSAEVKKGRWDHLGARPAGRAVPRTRDSFVEQEKEPEMLLEIQNLHASVEGKEILRGLDLTIRPGEVHAIMGPNGSGKSTLAQVLAGKDDYEVTAGRVLMDGQDLLELAPEVRAREGIFLAFQYPVEIPGVSNTYFLKAAVNAVRKHRGQSEYDAIDFLKLVRQKVKLVGLDESLLQRPVNEGFSGGEKKRNEIFHMAVLEPKLCVLDETDSGLDIDALRIVADGVNSLRAPDRSFLVITHYQRLLNYIVPDFVHVLIDGRIVQSGGKELALELEDKGYSWLEVEPAPAPATV
jgi:Fe-S cluster assembly ATP-binding protein